MSSELKQAVINTLLYADIFSYPLTKDEIWKWLIGYKISHRNFSQQLKKINCIHKKNNYYYLKTRKKIVNLRIKREKYSGEKYKILNKTVAKLKHIPSVKLIGISGALAINNSDIEDDIDLFIITKKNMVWITRLLCTLVTDICRERRRPTDKNFKNKICLNMFISEDHLALAEPQRDLYLAHEVLQMRPIYQIQNIYARYLTKNKWVQKYLPNAYPKTGELKCEEINMYQFPYFIMEIPIIFIEFILKLLQLAYMSKSRTNEVFTCGVIRFHPKDARNWILDKYYSSF